MCVCGLCKVYVIKVFIWLWGFRRAVQRSFRLDLLCVRGEWEITSAVRRGKVKNNLSSLLSLSLSLSLILFFLAVLPLTCGAFPLSLLLAFLKHTGSHFLFYSFLFAHCLLLCALPHSASFTWRLINDKTKEQAQIKFKL